MWNIPVPDFGESDTPKVVISPLVGVDTDFYRLGNGGVTMIELWQPLATNPSL